MCVRVCVYMCIDYGVNIYFVFFVCGGQIFSNGRYKSVLHRALVNEASSRISVVSLHSLPFSYTVRPWTKLISEKNPQQYKDTNFGDFIHYLSTNEPKGKDFLQSRMLDVRAK